MKSSLAIFPVSLMFSGIVLFSGAFAQNAPTGAEKLPSSAKIEAKADKKPDYETCIAQQSEELKRNIENEKKRFHAILDGEGLEKQLPEITSLAYNVTLNQAGYTSAIISAVKGKPKPVIKAVAKGIYEARKQLLKNEKAGVCPVGSDLILAAVASADPEFQAEYTALADLDPTTSIGDEGGFNNLPRNNSVSNQNLIGTLNNVPTPASPN